MNGPNELILQKTQLQLPAGSSLTPTNCVANPTCCDESPVSRVTFPACGDLPPLDLPSKLYARFQWLPEGVSWGETFGSVDPLNFESVFAVDKYCEWISNTTFTLNYTESTMYFGGTPLNPARLYYYNSLGVPIESLEMPSNYPCCQVILYLMLNCNNYSYYTGNKIYPYPDNPAISDWELYTQYYRMPYVGGIVKWHTAWDAASHTCRFDGTPLFGYPMWDIWTAPFMDYSLQPFYAAYLTAVWKRLIIWE